MKSAFWWGFCV